MPTIELVKFLLQYGPRAIKNVPDQKGQLTIKYNFIIVSLSGSLRRKTKCLRDEKKPYFT